MTKATSARSSTPPRTPRRLTVAAAQIIGESDIRASTQIVLKRIDEAAKAGVHVIGFPEGTLFGYTTRKAYWRSAKPENFAAAERSIARRCRTRNVAAVVGSAHQIDGQWYNSLAIIDETGAIKARYSKTFLAGELWFKNNRGPLPIVRLHGAKCCFIICHDVRYPELVRLPAMAGAQVCWFCSCESGLTYEHKLSAYRAMPIARATENGIYLVMANTPADADDIHRDGASHGNSKIVAPDGNVIAEAGHFEQRLVVATIDLTAADRWVARRAGGDQTILKPWLNQAAADFVQVID